MCWVNICKEYMAYASIYWIDTSLADSAELWLISNAVSALTN